MRWNDGLYRNSRKTCFSADVCPAMSRLLLPEGSWFGHLVLMVAECESEAKPLIP